MNGYRIDKLVIWVFIIIGGLCSCRSSKDNRGEAGIISVESAGAFTSRARFILSDGKKDQSINGTVRMVRDEFIQISLLAPVLRTEAVRIQVTPERMLLIDRINKQYATAPAADLQRLLGAGMDYRRLQDILIEAVFIEDPAGWLMRGSNVRIAIPFHDQGTETGQLLIELNRVALPGGKLTPATPPSRYDEKELSVVIEDIEKL